MSKAQDSNRFDDWQYADCNTCGNYYNDTCDGVKPGTTRKCTAYIATRGKDLPRMIGKVQKQLYWGYLGIAILFIGLILCYVTR